MQSNELFVFLFGGVGQEIIDLEPIPGPARPRGGLGKAPAGAPHDLYSFQPGRQILKPFRDVRLTPLRLHWRSWFSVGSGFYAESSVKYFRAQRKAYAKVWEEKRLALVTEREAKVTFVCDSHRSRCTLVPGKPRSRYTRVPGPR